jgi:hypothetical protein
MFISPPLIKYYDCYYCDYYCYSYYYCSCFHWYKIPLSFFYLYLPLSLSPSPSFSTLLVIFFTLTFYEVDYIIIKSDIQMSIFHFMKYNINVYVRVCLCVQVYNVVIIRGYSIKDLCNTALLEYFVFYPKI